VDVNQRTLSSSDAFGGGQAGEAGPEKSRRVPWQIWVVVFLLGMEGVSNFLMIPDEPIALYWLLGKILFIWGLLKGRAWVFVLFLIVAAYHVIGFLEINPVASAMNVLLVTLTLSARRYYFLR
jgi:hypothetical protein